MFTLALGIILVVLIVWHLCSKPTNFPPGPFRWPFLGSVRMFKTLGLYRMAREMALEYGDISGFYLGTQPMVVISSLEAFKEVSAREDLSGRPISKTGNDVNVGILLNSGEEWRSQRRFTLRHLRDLGFGKRSMEGILHREISTMLKEVERKSGPDFKKPVQIHKILGTSGVNVLWHIMAGKRYEHEDERLLNLLALLKTYTAETSAAGSTESFFPWVTKVAPDLTGLTKQRSIRNAIRVFIRQDIEEHKKTLDPDHPRDFMDMYLSELQTQLREPQTYFSESVLTDICRDLFGAGSDTTFNTITFSLVYMVKFPEVQRKVQEELDQVVGQDRLPSLQDREKLVYTDATVHEVLRMSSVVPLGVPHAPSFEREDVKFRGYVIPKNARVLLNIGHIHHNTATWGDPENFRPERFLSPDGLRLQKHESLVPFGLGKRQCLGEALARNSVFFFFAATLQRFSLCVPPGSPPPSLEPVGGITLAPKPFFATFTPRFIAS